jgi:hypothetical protein
MIPLGYKGGVNAIGGYIPDLPGERQYNGPVGRVVRRSVPRLGEPIRLCVKEEYTHFQGDQKNNLPVALSNFYAC